MESLVWMFKEKDFTKHYWYLVIGTIILTIFSVIGIIILPSLLNAVNIQNIFIIQAILFIAILIPCLFPTGYYWELTENIISRQIDISANNIYDGKIKEQYKIELPELKATKFIWRGFASIIASIIMVLPYLILVGLSIFSGSCAQVSPWIFLTSLIMFSLLIPGLLWNYAKQNSVVSVLNISKAIYLMGNYSFRYFKAIFLMILFNIVNAFLDKYIVKMILPYIKKDFDFQDCLLIGGLFVYLILIFLKDMYMIFVYAHILGTITPAEES